MIKKGDPVKVRLGTGLAVEASYVHPGVIPKHHVVCILNTYLDVIGKNNRSRFVGNPCVLVPVEVSV